MRVPIVDAAARIPILPLVRQSKISRRIDPPADQFHLLRQPLTSGELEVFRLFDAKLDPDWEIYLQPHLNGLRPDFVLLHPRSGIAVFEVKDWDLDAMRYYAKLDSRGSPRLWGSDGIREFSLEDKNPFAAIRRYKDRIFNLYCPRIAQGRGYGTITAGVIFTRATSSRVKDLARSLAKDGRGDVGHAYYPVSGMDDLREGRIGVVFPKHSRKSSDFMNSDLADDLRGWLVESDHIASQRIPLQLDARQRIYAETRTKSGFRRLKGPAGSGKSLVLCARAAKLAAEGKSVLVVNFNITLLNHLRDLTSRNVSTSSGLRNVTFKNFHLWCREACEDAGLAEHYKDLWGSVGTMTDEEVERTLEEDVPALAKRAASMGLGERYDAILVDEGQDMRPHWWDVLKDYRKPGGEMVLVADTTQDVYGKAGAWTESAMAGAGFSGGWVVLETCYRLPARARALADAYARRYIPQNMLVLQPAVQTEADLEPFVLNWVQCLEADASENCITAMRELSKQAGRNGLARSDMVFVTGDAKIGRTVSVDLEKRFGVRIVHTLSADRQANRREKMAFFMGREGVKATTMLSFKGWESRLLIVYIPRSKRRTDSASIYAALTRIKRDPRGSWMTIVCSDPDLEEFGRSMCESE